MTANKDQSIEYVALSALNAYDRNSKTHSHSQIQKLAESIRQFGFVAPVLIDADNTIIAGHGRVMAADYLGLEQVPCLRVTHLTEPQKRAYVIADNRLSELGGWDMDMLASEVDALQAEGMEVDFLSVDDLFDEDDLIEDAHAAKNQSDETGEEQEKEKPQRNVYPLVLPLNRKQYELWQKLKAEYNCGDIALFEKMTG